MRNYAPLRKCIGTIAGPVCLLLLLAGGLLPRTEAATNVPPKAEAAPSATNSLAAIEIPKSTFIIPTTTSQGRDPFFPLSRRMVVDATPKTGTTPIAAPVNFVLQGISGTESKRFALINGRTLVVGEEREVPSGTTRVQVRCLEIREDSVKIEVNGVTSELKLRPGL